MIPQPLLEALWPLALLFPLLITAGLLADKTRRVALNLVPLGALPALGLALFPEPGGVARAEIPWLLLGSSFGLTDTTRVFLLFTAVLWTLSAVYGRYYLAGDGRQHRFFVFFLVTMTGNLGLIMARDLASFYLFFTLMSFVAYGMVVHEGTDRALRAGRVYLTMTIIGEAFVLPAVLIAAATTGLSLDGLASGLAEAPVRDAVVLLALLGYGVKAGALGLHVWLPLAHPAAPTPASAVLSGSMIKAGLLGWIVFLPGGEAGLAGWGLLVMAVGGAAAFYGALVGVVQEEPKTILAYSSISQMGFMMVGLGAGLTAPGSWSVALTAVTFYAIHHAFVKGALFLGVGLAEDVAGHRDSLRRLVLAGLVLGALAIAGAAPTSGAAAKSLLQSAAELAPGPWGYIFYELLSLAAIASTLIMVRFLIAVWPRQGMERGVPLGLLAPWAALLAGILGTLLFLPEPPSELLFSFSAVWPVAVGVVLAGAAWALRRRLGYRRGSPVEPRIPEGDLLVPAIRLLAYLGRVWTGRIYPVRERFAGRLSSRVSLHESWSSRLHEATARAEGKIRHWTVAGTLALLLAGALLILGALAA